MNSSGAQRRTERARRAISVLLALYVLGLALAGWHQAAHAHRVCEHGEIVHVDSCSDGGTTAPAHDEEAPRLAVDSNSEPTGAEHGHEHCFESLPAMRAERVALVIALNVLDASFALDELHAAIAHRTSEPLYALAPTLSPPSV